MTLDLSYSGPFIATTMPRLLQKYVNSASAPRLCIYIPTNENRLDNASNSPTPFQFRRYLHSLSHEGTVLLRRHPDMARLLDSEEELRCRSTYSERSDARD